MSSKLMTIVGKSICVAIVVGLMTKPIISQTGGQSKDVRILAIQWSKKKNWPLKRVTVRTVDHVTDLNVDKWIDRIVDAIATVKVEHGRMEVFRFADESNFKTIRQKAVETFRSGHFIAPGDTILEVHWSFVGGFANRPISELQTYAVNDQKRELTFEPVLYLTAITVPVVPTLHHSILTVGPMGFQTTNGEGKLCAESIWEVTVTTDDDCEIVDPAPHVSQNPPLGCKIHCPYYSASCTNSEEKYTQRGTCTVGNLEQCIKYVVKWVWASGPEKTTEKSFRGLVTIPGTNISGGGDVKVVESGKEGEAGTNEAIGTLCATGSERAEAIYAGKPALITTTVNGVSVTGPTPPPSGKGACCPQENCTGTCERETLTACAASVPGTKSWLGPNNVCYSLK